MDPTLESLIQRVVARVVRERTSASRPQGVPQAVKTLQVQAPPPVLPIMGPWAAASATTSLLRPIVDAEAIQGLKRGSSFEVADGSVWTPLARDLARERGITVKVVNSELRRATVAVGADHGGFRLKQAIRAWLEMQQYRVVDVGTASEASCDYPDFALDVARTVAAGRSAFGIMVDGAGIGSSMVGNRVPGVLAALCSSPDAARNAREHNLANMLTLGAKSLTEGQAFEIVKIFLTTAEGDARHHRRVDKIRALDR